MKNIKIMGNKFMQDIVKGPVLDDVEVVKDVRGKYGKLNILVLVCQYIVVFSILYLMACNIFLPIKIILVLFSCLVLQGVFGLMHECFHLHGHGNKKINYLIGFFASILFGTNYTLHRVNHWGHHKRNRSKPERAEYVHEDEKYSYKTFVYYVAIFGGLYISSLIFALLIPIIPYRFVRYLALTREHNTYSAAFLDFSLKEWRMIQVEGVFLIIFWTAIFIFFQQLIIPIIICYGVFAVTWSLQQWVYHLYTPIHVIDGVYNLRAPRFVSFLLLHFNCNGTHHADPTIPWPEIYAKTDMKKTQPLLYRIFYIMQPPKYLPKDIDTIQKRYF